MSGKKGMEWDQNKKTNYHYKVNTRFDVGTMQKLKKYSQLKRWKPGQAVRYIVGDFLENQENLDASA